MKKLHFLILLVSGITIKGINAQYRNYQTIGISDILIYNSADKELVRFDKDLLKKRWGKSVLVPQWINVLEDETIFCGLTSNQNQTVFVNDFYLIPNTSYIVKMDGKTGKLMNIKSNRTYYSGLIHQNDKLYTLGDDYAFVTLDKNLVKLDSIRLPFIYSVSVVPFLHHVDKSGYSYIRWHDGKNTVFSQFRKDVPHYSLKYDGYSFVFDEDRNQLFTLSTSSSSNRLLLRRYNLDDGTLIEEDSSVVRAGKTMGYHLNLDKNGNIYLAHSLIPTSSTTNTLTILIYANTDIKTPIGILKKTLPSTALGCPTFVSNDLNRVYYEFVYSFYDIVDWIDNLPIVTSTEAESIPKTESIYAANQHLHINVQPSDQYSVLVVRTDGITAYSSNQYQAIVPLQPDFYMVRISNGDEIFTKKVLVR